MTLHRYFAARMTGLVAQMVHQLCRWVTGHSAPRKGPHKPFDKHCKSMSCRTRTSVVAPVAVEGVLVAHGASLQQRRRHLRVPRQAGVVQRDAVPAVALVDVRQIGVQQIPADGGTEASNVLRSGDKMRIMGPALGAQTNQS